jgi:hypothetical protein
MAQNLFSLQLNMEVLTSPFACTSLGALTIRSNVIIVQRVLIKASDHCDVKMQWIPLIIMCVIE